MADTAKPGKSGMISPLDCPKPEGNPGPPNKPLVPIVGPSDPLGIVPGGKKKE